MHGLLKGYDRKQVDAFLTRADLALNGAIPTLTAADIRRTGFELVHRGYQVEVVDQVLDEMEMQAVLLAAATSRRGRLDPVAEAEFLRAELAAPYMRRFPRVRFPRRGYAFDDVDEFLDRVGAALDAAIASVATDVGGLTVADVRTVAFRPKRGGYAEDAVDETLDRVVEMMLLIQAGARQEQPPLSMPAD
ncbi:MAG: DivIVA domain-containing protein [Sporichthyaceae bacterium]